MPEEEETDELEYLKMRIRKSIALRKKSNFGVGFDDAEGYAHDLGQIREDIMFLANKHPDTAKDFMLSLINIREDVFASTYDGDGVMCSFFSQCIGDLGKIYAKLSADTSEIVDLVYNLYVNDDFDVTDEIINDFKDALKEEGMILLKDKFIKARPQVQRATQGLKDIAKCADNIDDYIAACSNGASACDYDRIEIASKLTMRGRCEEALKWLAGMHNPTHVLWAHYYYRVKVDTLLAAGDESEAQVERMRWLRYAPSRKIYDEIIDSAGSDEFRQQFITEAIEIAFKYDDIYTGMKFLVELGEFGKCAELIYAKLETKIDGCNYRELRPIISALRNVEPLAAMLLCRKILERILNKRTSQYYKFAARDLVDCGKLSEKITNFRGYKNHDEYFAMIKAKHGKQRAFWRELEEMAGGSGN
jgi:hypothetical protein